MNASKIKSCAPKARRDFIEAVTRRAAKFGIMEKAIAPVEETGEAFPKRIGAQRRKLKVTRKRQVFRWVNGKNSL
jgi:hypothetical protein